MTSNCHVLATAVTTQLGFRNIGIVTNINHDEQRYIQPTSEKNWTEKNSN